MTTRSILINLDVNVVLLWTAANQRREFMGMLHVDWLPHEVWQDWRLDQLVNILGLFYKNYVAYIIEEFI